MPRAKKESKTLNAKLDLHVFDQLEQFCEESGLQKTTAVERILGEFFDKYFNKPEEERKLFK